MVAALTPPVPLSLVRGVRAFDEDAVEETTATASGVSAEYGRFAGGVVNVLTKSGGNRFSGSGDCRRASASVDISSGDTKAAPLPSAAAGAKAG
mgnify:CR=1 FL=1